MSRAIDRIGWEPPDRGEDHDTLTAWLVRPGVGERLVADWLEAYPHPAAPENVRITNCAIEVPITKGDGPYRTLVAYIDARYELSWTVRNLTDDVAIAIEVKTETPLPVGALLRQIKHQRVYAEVGRAPGTARIVGWWLVTPHPLPESVLRVLRAENIAPGSFVPSPPSDDNEEQGYGFAFQMPDDKKLDAKIRLNSLADYPVGRTWMCACGTRNPRARTGRRVLVCGICGADRP